MWGIGLLFLFSLGCEEHDPSRETVENPFPYAGIEVRVVLPQGLHLPSQWAPGFEDWATRTSASYSVSEIGFSESTSDDDDWLSALQAGSPTLVLLPTTYVNRLIAEGLAASIPDSALSEDVLDWNRIPPPVRKALGMQGEQPTVFPVTCPTLVAFYRQDLLDAAGRQLPRTWDEYDDLVASVSEWAPGHFAIEPRGTDSLATLFLARAVGGAKRPTQYSFTLDVSTGDPLISSSAFVRALERMGKLSPHLSPDSPTASFEHCWGAALRGTAAIGIATLNAESVAIGERLAKENAAANGEALIEFAPLPGSRSVFDRESQEWTSLDADAVNLPAVCGFGGVSACVMKAASEAEQAAAWDLWGSLAALQKEGILLPLPGLPSDSSVLGAAVLTEAEGLAATSQRSFVQAVTSNMHNPQLTAELPCFGRERLLAALSDAIRGTLEEGVPAEQALAQAARRWTVFIDEIGSQRVLNSYRQRLGLTRIP